MTPEQCRELAANERMHAFWQVVAGFVAIWIVLWILSKFFPWAARFVDWLGKP